MRRLWSTHPDDVDGLSNEDLRERFVVSDLFAPGEIRFAYTHDDRMVIGGAVVTGNSLQLTCPLNCGHRTSWIVASWESLDSTGRSP